MNRSTTVAIAAAALALGSIGSATAAGMITGARIKDKTLGPGDLLVRVATAKTDNNAATGVTGEVGVLQTRITAPTKGYLVVTASSDVYDHTAVSASSDCWINLGDKYAVGSRRSIQLSTSGNREEDCNTNVTIPVAAGTRTVKFRAVLTATTTTYDEATLEVLFVPFNGKGKRPTNSEITGALQVPPRPTLGNLH